MKGDFGAMGFVRLDFDFAAVFAEDTADDEEAKAGAARFGGGIRFKEGAEDFGGDAGTGVIDADEDFVLVEGATDGDFASGGGDGLIGVLDEVEEGLPNLVRVEGKLGEVFVELEVNLDVARNELGLKGLEGVANEVVDLGGLHDGARRADGVEKLLQEAIEAADFGPSGGEMLEKGFAVAGGELFDFSLQELEMNAEGVEGVTDLVRDSGSEQGESVELFGFEIFLGGAAGFGEVAHEHDGAEVARGAFNVFDDG